jgi:exosortase A-associated hydrolase 1
MNAEEVAVTFDCLGETLVGIVHVPEKPASRGLLCVLAGGPQYRIGCCRQQVLLARRLASTGTPVMRFDYRSMGDAGGTDPGLDRTEDINAAADAFMRHVPGLKDIVLYGGCDGASAIAISGWRQPNVSGWILNNPFTKNEETQAKVMIKHYYRQRLFSKQLWKKVLRFEFDFREAFSSLAQTLRKASSKSVASQVPAKDPFDPSRPFTERMLEGWKRFDGDVLLLIGGRSLVAKAFDECVAGSKEWQAVTGRPQVHRHVMANADHTFSEPQSRESLFEVLIEWLHSKC